MNNSNFIQIEIDGQMVNTFANPRNMTEAEKAKHEEELQHLRNIGVLIYG